MASRNPGKKVPRKRKKVQRGRPPIRKDIRKKTAKKRAPKKRAPKKRAPKKKPRLRKKPRVRKERKPRIGRFTVVPRSWKKLTNHELERMTAQIVQRIGEKIVGGGHAMKSAEAKILKALIAAEQRGELNAEFYEQAGRYRDYETPQEVYQLWIYSGT